MSPIGRTFIVLNLILAGTFVGFAGTFLQKQYHWKEAHEAVSKELDETRAAAAAEETRLRGEVSELRGSNSNMQASLEATQRELEQERDETKRLRAITADQTASIKALQSQGESMRATVEAGMTKATEAMALATNCLKERDDAIRAKDAAVAENRSLTNTVAELNSTIEQKDLALADLRKDNSEQKLLVDAARVKGFIDRMAVPVLDGTVSIVSGNLVTLAITNNPSEAEIKPGYKFAIYDAAQSKYLGEVRVTSVDNERNAAFCTFEIKKGDVKVGDKASTHLAGTTN